MPVSAGLAKTIEKYFGIREALKRACCKVGTAEYTKVCGRGIYNLVTKERYFEKPQEIDLKCALQDLKRQMIKYEEKFLAIPKLGAGLDRLQLSRVIALIFDVFSETDITIQMYDYGENNAWDDMITSFEGEYEFLSNYYECPIEIDGKIYKSVEHAYHSRKLTNSVQQQVIQNVDPKDVGSVVCKWPVCSDWNSVRDNWMVRCVHEKFKQIPRLRAKLLATGSKFLLNQNYSHQQFLGTCACSDHRKIPGDNILGCILMREREAARLG